MNACDDSVMYGTETVYLIDSQTDLIINSDGIGEMKVYLRGIKSGSDNTIYCNNNDLCIIDCGTQDSCHGLLLYCFGKCDIKCDENQGML